MTGMNGLLGYATYLPAWRTDPRGGDRATRVVAAFDEDATTMAVEAAARALGDREPATVESLLLATSSPPYADKTNATAVHAALGLSPSAFAADLGSTARSTFAALRLAALGGGLVVASDVRVGRPGSADERGGA
ncbi:MAG: hypothetical protein QM572_10735, partial [Nocardioides sp.]